MQTLAEQFEQYQEAIYNDAVVEYLSTKNLVVSIKPIIENHYLLTLAVDKDAAAIFIRFLNVSGNIVTYEKVKGEPRVIISLYIPEKENYKLLQEIDFAFEKVNDYLKYQKMLSDYRKPVPVYHFSDWLSNKIPIHHFSHS